MVIQETNWWNRLTAQLCCTGFVEMKTTSSCAKIPKLCQEGTWKEIQKI